MSKRRKRVKGKSSARPPQQFRSDQRDRCDCPACTGAGVDLDQLFDVVLDGAGDVAGIENPFDAEMLGAALLAMFATVPGSEQALVGGLIPELEARAESTAMALLLALGSVGGDPIGAAASAAAARMGRAGVARPPWADELAEPFTVTGCRVLSDPDRAIAVLICTWHRAGRSDVVMIKVNGLDCGAADNIAVFDEEHLNEAIAMLQDLASDIAVELTTDVLDQAEFRWQVERALDARAVHDANDEVVALPEDDSDGPGYAPLALIVRARLKAMPEPDKPPAVHEGTMLDLAALEQLAAIATSARDISGGRLNRRPEMLKLPPRRAKSAPPAPIYQIKVGLSGAKPPIWRRLEVPADISLARLHTTIQAAFGWDDSHLHVFETPHGTFGVADTELGFRSEVPVTLEQVAPAPKSQILYTYDFGDSWRHDIQVEKVLGRDDTVAYPRCTGGRRAAPPEDCGGVWGYGALVDILANPTDPEHRDRLEWLGLDSAAGFDPAAFDAEAISKALPPSGGGRRPGSRNER